MEDIFWLPSCCVLNVGQMSTTSRRGNMFRLERIESRQSQQEVLNTLDVPR